MTSYMIALISINAENLKHLLHNQNIEVLFISPTINFILLKTS